MRLRLRRNFFGTVAIAVAKDYFSRVAVAIAPQLILPCGCNLASHYHFIAFHRQSTPSNHGSHHRSHHRSTVHDVTIIHSIHLHHQFIPTLHHASCSHHAAAQSSQSAQHIIIRTSFNQQQWKKRWSKTSRCSRSWRR